MPVLCSYLLKLSLSLTILYLFYHLLLRRLTFYQLNRIYLFGYSVLCFLLPLINIADLFKHRETQWMLQVPSVQNISLIKASADGTDVPVYWQWVLLIILVGAAWFICRLIIQVISFQQMHRAAMLVSDENINLYQVDSNIIPFSFANSIYVNQELHTTEELREIVQHEFVHVKQLHTMDIIWSELLCVLNWYNPFAWMIRNAIRQNLEFIADDKVVRNGVDRKEYQHLLLKVMGNRQFTITNQFNFSSLKKRIAMMNKIKTHRLQLLRLLLLLPAITILLLAFRQKINQEAGLSVTADVKSHPQTAQDTTRKLNEKGYYVIIQDNYGNCQVVIRDRNNTLVKSLSLDDWKKKEDYYEGLYGEIPPPPPPVPPTPPAPRVIVSSINEVIPPTPPAMKEVTIAAPPTPPTIQEITIVAAPPMPPTMNEIAIIAAPPTPTTMKEIAIVAVPSAPVKTEIGVIATLPAQESPTIPAPPKVAALPANVKGISIHNDKAEVELKNGEKEKYDLSIPDQKASFEKKYGKMPEPPPPPASPRKTL